MILISSLKTGLQKTRQLLGNGLLNVLHKKETIDSSLLEAMETQLLMADVGFQTTANLLKQWTSEIKKNPHQNLLESFKSLLIQRLQEVEKPLTLDASKHPFVILIIGVNGSGKTTTLGRLTRQFRQKGQSVMLAAGDTFRAAAIEQLKIWGQRNSVPVIAQHPGADSASVIFEALETAQSQSIDILLADTAGRLHTEAHLMDELRKIKKVITKLDHTAPHEILLVLDATNGQNALQQAKQFNAALPVTGLVLTKLDGTSKGGILFSIAHELKIPIRWIGIGEQMDDLKPFSAKEFVEAIILYENSHDDPIQSSQ